MRIVHRVSIASTPEIRDELARIGFVVRANGFVTLDVDETHEAWPQLQRWITKRRASDFASTRFSSQEIDASRWLILVPDWHCGYPQPRESEFGYRETTYDRTGYCEQCGIGMKQKAPFQMKGEPKWRGNGILQLNWVFDEYFVTPEVWRTVFQPYGVKCRLVMDTKGMELKTVVQLVVEEEVSVVTDGLPGEKCRSCGRVKYLPVVRGPFPPLAREPSTSMVTTTEYFGSGASAHKGVLVSQAVARALTAEKVRGASLKPVKGLPSTLSFDESW